MQVKLNLGRLSVSEKIALGRQIVQALTNNSTFPNQHPPLNAMTTAVDDLDQAAREVLEVRQLSKQKTSIQNTKEDVVDKLLTQAASYVDSIAGGDEAIILSAGMGKRTASGPSTMPNAPLSVVASAGDRDGEIDLSWEPVSNATSYVIETSPDPVTPASWTNRTVSTRSTWTAEGLTSGGRYWFRIAAINAAGQSGWSDPATKIAP